MYQTTSKPLATFFGKYPTEQLKKGTLIHRPGQRPTALHYIEHGYVKLYALSPDGAEKLLVILMPGELFSLSATLQSLPTSFYAQALTAVRLRSAPRDEFLDFIHSNSQILDDVIAVLTKTITVLNNRVFTLSLTRAYDRLISRLQALVELFGVLQPNGNIRIAVPLTHQEIANSINLSRESTSKALYRLQKEGVLSYHNGNIVVHKPQVLSGPTT